ncbi:GGDEF domain-containing protein [Motiliproteus sp. MSK22-1]|uniref:GGDEF domain-containing protein n=1 Tax=Motiliproteus sp. MSK22-1 TaxID=1897630 RepID=UPI0009762009|nr:GGDEF domain-containing protein [Motiliproteus sp. MSK22-1]OMH39507.1 hypothetical protein BGP75_02640 [Motiliproteus sp. MSK22-1]
MISGQSTNFPRRVSILFHLVAIAPVLGFTLYHGIWGSHWLSLFLGGSLLVVSLSLYNEFKHRDSLLYRQMFVVLVSFSIALSCYQLGLRGLIYVFPMSSVFFFTFPFVQGIVSGVIFSLCCLLAASYVEPLILVLRFSVGITISMVFAGIFAFIVLKQKNKLEQLANRDELTGALNRRTLRPELDAAKNMHQRHQQSESLAIMDLDHFKQVNDLHGHLVGDEVLKEFSQLVAGRIRNSDKLFRFGGEEFILQLPQTDEQQAWELCEALRALVEATSFSNNIRLTCSFGVAQLTADESVDSWLKGCDKALYQAKESGRNKVLKRSSGYRPQ